MFNLLTNFDGHHYPKLSILFHTNLLLTQYTIMIYDENNIVIVVMISLIWSSYSSNQLFKSKTGKLWLLWILIMNRPAFRDFLTICKKLKKLNYQKAFISNFFSIYIIFKRYLIKCKTFAWKNINHLPWRQKPKLSNCILYHQFGEFDLRVYSIIIIFTYK